MYIALNQLTKNLRYITMITRTIELSIRKELDCGNKAVILLGARQVGKTTLVSALFGERDDILWLNGDEPDVAALFADMSSTRLKAIIGAASVVVIDEAQRIPDVGLKLKLITDQIRNVKLIATGSSSLHLAGQVNEPLTGRKREFVLFPVSCADMVNDHGLSDDTR
jgi:predicted AAA+ superfamily ATPase